MVSDANTKLLCLLFFCLLAVTVQVSAPKIRSIQSTSKGVVLKPRKAGTCLLRIWTSDNATFEDSPYSATMQVK